MGLCLSKRHCGLVPVELSDGSIFIDFLINYPRDLELDR